MAGVGAYEVQLADAVVAEINDPARGWALPLEASRTWLTVWKGVDLSRPRAAVSPLSLTTTPLTRRPPQRQCEYQLAIDIAATVQQKDQQDNSEVDQLTSLAQAVHDFYSDYHELKDMPGWHVITAAREDLYDLERLYSDHTFETLILVNVRGFR